MPIGAVYVGRPTVFGNWCPGGRRLSVANYRRWLLDGFEGQAKPARRKVLELLPTLRGKDLACWCPLDEPCHADVLLDLANRPRGDMVGTRADYVVHPEERRGG